MIHRLSVWIFAVALLLSASSRADAAETRTFEPGSLIIPMDLAYQDHGMLQAYGLVYQLLSHGVTVYWVIDSDKTWHAAPCDTPGDTCDWDCTEEGSGEKCPYPTASPDLYAATKVVWDDGATLPPDTPIARHGYRGGPFMVDAQEAARARPIIDAWNDQSLWSQNPWAQRTVFHPVSVHELTAAAEGTVRKTMVAAPSIAVFSDGNENIATGYLRAAGIPQSNGLEFPDGKCNEACGPGTDNPDMLTVESIMGEMGTCDAPNLDHKNGALFTADGAPAYCQIMSMHWDVNNREKVQCDGGGCPATQQECNGERFTYHGHEVVAEVRQFLQYPTHFFAECQAVNAYENTVPNPAWPFLDDADREGHYLTTTGIIPDCPCTEDGFECVAGGCDAGTRDCCLPKSDKELGAGFLIASQPSSDELKIFYPFIPYNQLDGFFGTEGGSEPAYNLSTYLQTAYKNDQEITFISGPDGPGVQDVWMTGYMDGECWIGSDDVSSGTQCSGGKVSYLGGHSYSTNVPISSNANSQGTRLFLNALFEADCVTSVGQPQIALWVDGQLSLSGDGLPTVERYTITYSNAGAGAALMGELELSVPNGVVVDGVETGGAPSGSVVTWQTGSIGGQPVRAGDPPTNGGRWVDLRFAERGDYPLQLTLRYRVGSSAKEATAQVVIHVGTSASVDGGSSAADAGDGGTPSGSGGDGGCDCRTAHGSSTTGLGLSLLLLVVLLRRRRR